MRTTVLVTATLFASSVIAMPSFGHGSAACMSDDEAQQVATNFKGLIANYTKAEADQALTSGFVDYSSSVNTLIDFACGSKADNAPTFSNRMEFEKGQGAQPAIPFKQLNIWHTCNTVIIRWRSNQTPESVTGLIVMEAVPATSRTSTSYSWLIESVYSEFDSGAWLENLGQCTPQCSKNATSTSSAAAESTSLSGLSGVVGSLLGGLTAEATTASSKTATPSSKTMAPSTSTPCPESTGIWTRTHLGTTSSTPTGAPESSSAVLHLHRRN